MASGPFWPWVRTTVPSSLFREERWGISREIVFPEELVERRGAEFILIGYFPDTEWERAILKTVTEHNYKQIDVGMFNGKALTLYVSPKCAASLSHGAKG